MDRLKLRGSAAELQRFVYKAEAISDGVDVNISSVMLKQFLEAVSVITDCLLSKVNESELEVEVPA